MEKLLKKIRMLYEDYEGLLKEGDILIERLIEKETKELRRQYNQIKRKERNRLEKLIKTYYQYVEEKEINYTKFIKDQAKKLMLGNVENMNIWILITLIRYKKPDEDISLELCGLCKKILNNAEYSSVDEYYVENIIDLLFLWKNKVQILLLKEVILKEPNYDFRIVGKAISYLKAIKSEKINEVISDLKKSRKYEIDKGFQKNINENIPPEFWWMS